MNLKGEITNLLVTEENTYSTAVAMRFRLEDPSGAVLWEGIATGDAHQWGRSFEEENYNEEISDVLKRTYANLLSNPSFQAAWTGRRLEAGSREADAHRCQDQGSRDDEGRDRDQDDAPAICEALGSIRNSAPTTSWTGRRSVSPKK